MMKRNMPRVWHCTTRTWHALESLTETLAYLILRPSEFSSAINVLQFVWFSCWCHGKALIYDCVTSWAPSLVYFQNFFSFFIKSLSYCLRYDLLDKVKLKITSWQATKINNEPAHEIMVLFVLRKLIIQTRMRSQLVGLDVWFWSDPTSASILHCSNSECSGETARMHESSLVAYVIQ